MSLTMELEKLRKASRNRIPADKLAVMDRAARDLLESGITDTCLKEGDTAPDFVLPNAAGTSVSLSELLEQGPLVLSFYRGGW